MRSPSPELVVLVVLVGSITAISVLLLLALLVLDVVSRMSTMVLLGTQVLKYPVPSKLIFVWFVAFSAPRLHIGLLKRRWKRPLLSTGSMEARLTCNLVLQIQGRAIVVDLDHERDALGDACEVKHPHATILFKPDGFSEDELREITKFRSEWLHAKGRDEDGRCTFDVSERWGRRSNHVGGELRDFIDEARLLFAERFGCPLKEQREPHVQLRK